MKWIDTIKGVSRDETDGELSFADVVGQVAKGILALARHDARGKMVLPAGVEVRITAAGGSLKTLQVWAESPDTNREIDARLQNERIELADLPVRRWTVTGGDKNAIAVVDDPDPVVAVLVIQGGDHDGNRFAVGTGRREWRMGRGRWHSDSRLPNDIVLSESASWLSRGAAILRRVGSGFEVESRDQGEFLVVHPRDGTPRRPALSASGRVALAAGDSIEFHDGKEARLVLRVEPAGARPS